MDDDRITALEARVAAVETVLVYTAFRTLRTHKEVDAFWAGIAAAREGKEPFTSAPLMAQAYSPLDLLVLRLLEGFPEDQARKLEASAQQKAWRTAAIRKKTADD